MSMFGMNSGSPNKISSQVKAICQARTATAPRTFETRRVATVADRVPRGSSIQGGPSQLNIVI